MSITPMDTFTRLSAKACSQRLSYDDGVNMAHAADTEITRLRAELDRVTGERDALQLERDCVYAALQSAPQLEPAAMARGYVTQFWMAQYRDWWLKRLHGTTALSTPQPPAPDPAPEVPKCDGCEGNGMVGGLAPDGYHSEKCQFCGGTGRAK